MYAGKSIPAGFVDAKTLTLQDGCAGAGDALVFPVTPDEPGLLSPAFR